MGLIYVCFCFAYRVGGLVLVDVGARVLLGGGGSFRGGSFEAGSNSNGSSGLIDA